MYSFNSRIRYSEVDCNQKLKWISLLDYFQDCSFFHSEDKGVGIDYLNQHNIGWVLLYWHIRVADMPHANDNVETCTWPYDMKGFYGYRNFSMKDTCGKTLAEANSLWVLLDADSGRPAKIPDDLKNAYDYEPALEFGGNTRKIKLPGEYESGEKLIVPNHFIDTNLHMNNCKYVEVALGYIPANFNVKELKVEYRKSAMLGDVIVPHITIEERKATVVLTAEDGPVYAVVQFFE